MSNVMGHAIISCREFINRQFKKDEIESLKKKLSPELNGLLTDCDKEKFYPVNDFIKINIAICEILGKGDISIIKKIGRFSSTEAVKGFLKAFFMFGSPEFIIKQCVKVFSKYYDTGTLNLLGSSKNSVTAELTGFQIDDKSKMPYICRRIEGWIERSIEISAGKEAKTSQTKCIGKGDDSCVFETNW